MAKHMARVANGNVINVEWCSDRATETASLKECYDIPVAVGDRYEDGVYYRNGERLLSDAERLAATIAEQAAELEDMRSALNMLGVSLDE